MMLEALKKMSYNDDSFVPSQKLEAKFETNHVFFLAGNFLSALFGGNSYEHLYR